LQVHDLSPDTVHDWLVSHELSDWFPDPASTNDLYNALSIMRIVCPELKGAMISYIRTVLFSHTIEACLEMYDLRAIQYIATLDVALARGVSDFISTWSNQHRGYPVLEFVERERVLTKMSLEPTQRQLRPTAQEMSRALLDELGHRNPCRHIKYTYCTPTARTPAVFLLRLLNTSHEYGSSVAKCLGHDGIAKLASRLALPFIMAEFIHALSEVFPDLAASVAERLVEETALPEDWLIRYPGPDMDNTRLY